MQYGPASDATSMVTRDQLRAESLLEKLNAFDAALDAHWSRWYPRAREWYALHAGDQWDREARLELEAKKRNPVVMNRVDAMVSAISGAEISNRQTVRFAPREPGDVVVNELLTGAADWARDQCDAQDEESQGFRDCLICGLGSLEQSMNYLQDPEGMLAVDRRDPLEFAIDPSARKSNYVDANYIRRKRRINKDEKRKFFPQLCEQGSSGAGYYGGQHTRPLPGRAYSGKDGWEEAPVPPDQEEIIEYQWREVERCVLVINPANGEKVVLKPQDVARFAMAGVDPIADLGGMEIMQWVWWRAFRSGDHCIKEPLPDDEFTYKFITGKIDHNTGLPYGTVRAMVDPQRWSNKFLAQIDFIISSNAKGGILYEADAFEDPREAEERWAEGDSMIETTPGAVSKGKITNKPVPPYPQGIDRLFQIATAALPEVVGVNKEMLGIADQAQAGVLEYQRKQAAYGVLSVFFDSMKRYRKLAGRHMLKLIAKYMSDGRLIRITNPKSGQQQYVPLMHQSDIAKFDVIVDEAAAGPNQKERVWQMLLGLGQVMQSLQQLPPDMIVSIMEYSPLPASLVDKLRELIAKGQNDPNAQAMQQQMQQLQFAGQQAQVQKLQGEAAEANARAQKVLAEAQVVMPRLQIEAAKAKTEVEVQQQRMGLDFTRLQADVGLRMIDQRHAATQHEDSRADAREARLQDREDGMRSLRSPTGAIGSGKTANSEQALLYVLSGVAQTNQGVAEAMTKVAEAMSAPTEIIRDAQGRTAGARKVLPSRERGDPDPEPLAPPQPALTPSPIAENAPPA